MLVQTSRTSILYQIYYKFQYKLEKVLNNYSLNALNRIIGKDTLYTRHISQLLVEYVYYLLSTYGFYLPWKKLKYNYIVTDEIHILC